MSRSNRKLVKESSAALYQMKYEIAAEFGLITAGFKGASMDTEFAGELGASTSLQPHVNWSQLSTRQAGSVGGEITKRLVAQAEQVLGGQQLQ